MTSHSVVTADPSRPRSTTLLFLFILIVGASAVVMVAVPEGITQFGILLLLLVPALMLSMTDSGYLLPYVLAIWAFAPFVRRVLDWALGTYQSTSMVTLAPLLVTATLLIPLVTRPVVLTQAWRKILLSFGGALAYAAAVGVVRNGFSFLYDFAGYGFPPLIILYALSRPKAYAERDRYLKALVFLAILVSVYGWIQYLVVPPWDAFWMKHVPMGSIGKPIPLKIRVFSTMNAPGVTSLFLSTALGLMFTARSWRGTLGLLGLGLVASGLILTMVRVSWLTLLVFILVVIATSPGSQRFRSAVMVAIAAIMLVLLIPYLPGAKGISTRFQTFSSLDQDRSFTVRKQIAGNIVTTLLNDPIGKGIGGVGAGTKLMNSGRLGEDSVVDNGVLSLLKTFGLLGIVLFGRAIWLIGSAIRAEASDDVGWDIYRRVALAMLVATVSGLISSSNFSGMGGVLLWLLVALAFVKPPSALSPLGQAAASGALGRPV